MTQEQTVQDDTEFSRVVPSQFTVAQMLGLSRSFVFQFEESTIQKIRPFPEAVGVRSSNQIFVLSSQQFLNAAA